MNDELQTVTNILLVYIAMVLSVGLVVLGMIYDRLKDR